MTILITHIILPEINFLSVRAEKSEEPWIYTGSNQADSDINSILLHYWPHFEIPAIVVHGAEVKSRVIAHEFSECEAGLSAVDDSGKKLKNWTDFFPKMKKSHLHFHLSKSVINDVKVHHWRRAEHGGIASERGRHSFAHRSQIRYASFGTDWDEIL